jgi:hypothetical protein
VSGQEPFRAVLQNPRTILQFIRKNYEIDSKDVPVDLFSAFVSRSTGF